jgi:hypothetical protein
MSITIPTFETNCRLSFWDRVAIQDSNVNAIIGGKDDNLCCNIERRAVAKIRNRIPLNDETIISGALAPAQKVNTSIAMAKHGWVQIIPKCGNNSVWTTGIEEVLRIKVIPPIWLKCYVSIGTDAKRTACIDHATKVAK